MKKSWILFLGVLVVLEVFALTSLIDLAEDVPTGAAVRVVPPEKIMQNDSFLVVKVIDGDTIKINNGEVIRLICVDAPEYTMKWGRESKEYLEDLVLNKTVKLVKDVSERGKYGRLVRYVYLLDGTFVNEKIVRDGYAEVYWYRPDVTLCPKIQEAEDYARKHDLVIWEDGGDSDDGGSGGGSLTPPIKLDGGQNESNGGDDEDIDFGAFDCDSNAYNCVNFTSQAEAQAAFEYCGGLGNDIHRLDADYDGIACEHLL